MPRVPAFGDPPYGYLRRPRRRLLSAIALAVAVVLVPTIALATSISYRVSGIQVGVSGPDASTNYTSSFAGAADVDDAGRRVRALGGIGLPQWVQYRWQCNDPGRHLQAEEHRSVSERHVHGRHRGRITAVDDVVRE